MNHRKAPQDRRPDNQQGEERALHEAVKPGSGNLESELIVKCGSDVAHYATRFGEERQQPALEDRAGLPHRPRPVEFNDEIGDEYEAFSLHFEDDEIAGKEYLKIKERFGKYIDVYQNECHLDFAPLGCSKGNGILTIIDHFNIDSKDMAVIGDSYNDIPMLKVVDEAFTFNRSPEKVKQEAKYLVDGLDGCISILMD